MTHSAPSQELFETCYRGRQSAIHHAAYMRVGKVFPALELLRKGCFPTEGRRVFDYGFGAGTFFRYLPKTYCIFGVEQDPVTVSEVTTMLEPRGFPVVDLRPISIPQWRDHPLLQQQYDLILCSHVLEHVPDPVELLRRLGDCLAPGGTFLGLLPVNELRANAHHFHRVDRVLVRKWVESAGLELGIYSEDDPWAYWIQPLYAEDSNNRFLVQGLSLLMGCTAVLAGPRNWTSLGRIFASISRSKPTQACFTASAP